MDELGNYLSGPWPWGFLVGSGALLLALTVVAYRPAFTLLRRNESLTLLALRAGALASLILFLGVNWFGTAERRGKIAVLVDTSESMAIRDSMGGESRIDTARRLLDREGSFLKALTSRLEARRFVFDADFREVKAGDPSFRAEGEKTDLESALRKAAGAFPPGDLQGIVILSDGGATRGTDPAGAARELAVPLYPVGVGGADPERPGFKDLAVASVKGNDSVFVGNVHKIEVTVEGHGFSGLGPLEISVRRGGETEATATVTPEAGTFRRQATLSFRPDREGIFDYEISVPLQEGEAVVANNVFHFPLHVLGGKIRILYLEGTLRAEGKFLKRALDEDPNVECTALIRTGPGRFLHQGPGPSLVREGALNLGRDALDRFNVVILGDVERTGLPDAVVGSIERFVEEGGGGLLALGGHSALGAGGWGGSDLEKGLPVFLGTEMRREYPFLPALTADGVDHPIFAGYAAFFGPDAEARKGLPPLKGLSRVAGVKPGASVLATAGAGGPPLVAVQRFGRGKTMVLLSDTTWLWYLPLRGLGRESPFNRLWSQSVRWLTDTGKDLDESSPLRIWTPRRTYPAGTEVHLEVRLLPLPEGSLPYEGRPTARAIGPDGETTGVNLGGEGRIFTGRYPAKAPGIHRLRAGVARADGKQYEKEIAVVVGGRSEEFDRVALDEALLQRLAEGTGGRVFTPADGEALAEALEKRLDRGTRVADIARLDDPTFLILGLLLLCAEWALRRRKLLI